MQNISIEDAQKLFEWSYFTQRLSPDDLNSMQQDLMFMLDHGMMRNSIEIIPIVLSQALEP